MALPPEAARAKAARRKPPKPVLTGSRGDTGKGSQPKPVAAPPPNFPTYVPPKPGVTPAQAAAQRASERKRAKRVQLSAQRKRTGGDQPIIVKRREKVAKQAKTYAAAPLTPASERQIKAVGKVAKPEPQPITSKPTTRERKIQQAAVERQAKSKDVIFSRDPEVLKKAGFAPEGVGEKIAQAGPTALVNAITKDVPELVTTTPTSLAKLGVTAATHPKQLPKMLADPYIEAAKHPLKALTERPVTTALMFAPTVKVPGLAAGRVARVAAGEGAVAKIARGAKVVGIKPQTLQRPTATLEGTTLKQQRIGSRSYGKRARQTREDQGLPPRVKVVRPRDIVQAVKKPVPDIGPAAAKAGPKINRSELERRVDEFHDQSKYHVARVVAKKTAEAKKEAKAQGLSKTDRKAHIEDRASGARAGAGQEVERRFAREFGSHWQVGDKGTVIKPKHADEGHIFDNKTDAEKIAERVPFDAVVRTIKRETGPDQYGVVPRAADTRLASHRGVARDKSLGGKLLKTSSGTFRGAVLPLSGKWLAGQAVEAAFRTAVQHGGDPLIGPAKSLLRQRRVIKRMKELEKTGEVPKGSAQALLDRAAAGGQFGKGGVLRFEEKSGKTLEETFAGHRGIEDIAELATKAGNAPGLKQARKGWHAYQRVVFDVVNGAFEKTAQKAMLGKAIQQSPLMEKRILTLSKDAVDDAAKGLKGTHAQVELGRAVDRAYGKYSKFAPDKREMLAHTTPFLPWYQNTVKFLAQVLPEDHPVLTSLTASNQRATEEWRKANRLSQYSKDRVPTWLLGTYPLGGDRYRQVGRYLPFSPGSPVEAAGSLLLPQISGTTLALSPGVNWKGQRIKGGGWAQAREAALTTAEAHIPGVGLAGRVTGLSDKARGKKKKEGEASRSTLERLGRSLSPATPIETTSSTGGKFSGVQVKPVRVKPVRVKPVKIKPVRIP